MTGSIDLSIVIPVKGNFAQLLALLDDLASLPAQLVVVEANTQIKADSDSEELHDKCRQLICARNGSWLNTSASRGAQISLGIDNSNNQWIWVVHSDARLVDPVGLFFKDLSARAVVGWGRFDISFQEQNLRMQCVAFFMNWRSRWTSICTGDQGMFFHREALQRIGGFPKQPLMEDIEVSRRLKRDTHCDFLAPKLQLQASANRWLNQGWLRTVFSMWRYRIAYYFGKSAQAIYRQYYRQ
jgi:hypothetical protein